MAVPLKSVEYSDEELIWDPGKGINELHVAHYEYSWVISEREYWSAELHLRSNVRYY